MILCNLNCHRSSLNPNVKGLSAEVQLLPEGVLRLHYDLTGAISELSIPDVLTATAADGLWQHTCFEAFVGLNNKPGYIEYNFSPSTQCACYVFSDYRVNSPDVHVKTPQISVIKTNEQLQLTAQITLPTCFADKPLQIGVSAVIEAATGSLSYWALHHPAERPDFHDRASLILTLNPN